MSTNMSFAEHVLQVADQYPEFRPTAAYDKQGDCIEFIAEPDSFYAERVDDLVTVYYSHETGEIVGSLLKGVSGFCSDVLKKNPGFRIEIQDGKVKLEHIFLARLWSIDTVSPDDIPTRTYRKLIEVAKMSQVEAEDLQVAC